LSPIIGSKLLSVDRKKILLFSNIVSIFPSKTVSRFTPVFLRNSSLEMACPTDFFEELSNTIVSITGLEDLFKLT
jgi:hypothetical protein